MLHPARLARVAAISSAIVMTLGVGARVAHSDEASGWYAGGLGGLNFTERSSGNYHGTGGFYDPQDDFTHKTGFAAGALAGYSFGSFRLQADVVYRYNSFDQEISYSFGTSTGIGHVTSVTPMLSALYDIPTGTSVTPYVGAGIGASNVDVYFRYQNSGHVKKLNFAYQAIAGLRYDVGNKWDVSAEYRYLGADSADYYKFFSDSAFGNSGYDQSNHSLLLALIYKFGDAPPAPIPVVAAPPPPPAPPAPELARSYLVFFDWNSSAVTAEAASIIGEAAKAARQLAVTRVELTGHADRSGSTAYNQQLSEKRGAAVKNALVQLGVPADQITVVGKGEASPLVPTADGVREPQNRRVEIVLP